MYFAFFGPSWIILWQNHWLQQRFSIPRKFLLFIEYSWISWWLHKRINFHVLRKNCNSQVYHQKTIPPGYLIVAKAKPNVKSRRVQRSLRCSLPSSLSAATWSPVPPPSPGYLTIAKAKPNAKSWRVAPYLLSAIQVPSQSKMDVFDSMKGLIFW